jgi:hypothetical protein
VGKHRFGRRPITRLDGRTVLYKGRDIMDALRFVLA